MLMPHDAQDKWKLLEKPLKINQLTDDETLLPDTFWTDMLEEKWKLYRCKQHLKSDLLQREVSTVIIGSCHCPQPVRHDSIVLVAYFSVLLSIN